MLRGDAATADKNPTAHRDSDVYYCRFINIDLVTRYPSSLVMMKSGFISKLL